MSIDFDGTGDYLRISTTSILTAPPITMACWFNADNITAHQPLMEMFDGSGGFNAFRLGARGELGGDPIVAETQNFLTVERASSGIGYSAGTWQHACGVWAASNDRRAYLNGAAKGVNVVNVVDPPGLDLLQIGAIATPTSLVSGLIAQAAIWNVALDDAEVGALGMRTPPRSVRPDALVFLLPMSGAHSPQFDEIARHALIVNGNPVSGGSDPDLEILLGQVAA